MFVFSTRLAVHTLRCSDHYQNRSLVYRVWRVAAWTSNLSAEFHYDQCTGSVQVHTPGIYLIYSQVYICLYSYHNNHPLNIKCYVLHS